MSGDVHDIAAGVQPERALIAALLRCVLTDAQCTERYRREDAQRWLRNRAVVEWWLMLAGLPESTYAVLLRKAGIDETPT